MKLLITGGAGFIGSNYVRWVLAHTADEVTVYDALTYAGNLASLRDVEERFGSRYRFVHADICDLPVLEEAVPATTPSSISRRRATSTGRSPAPTPSPSPTASGPTS